MEAALNGTRVHGGAGHGSRVASGAHDEREITRHPPRVFARRQKRTVERP